MIKMEDVGGTQTNFTGKVPVQMLAPDPAVPDVKKPLVFFHILQHKLYSRCVHPDKAESTMRTNHKTVMDDKGKGFMWVIGKIASEATSDERDTFTVKLSIQPDGFKKVTWEKDKKS